MFLGTSLDDSLSKNIEPVPPPIPTTPTSIKLTPDEITDELQTKLSAMEKLQYALTSHELQVAQRMAEQQRAAAGQIQVNVRSSSSDSSPTEANDVMEGGKAWLLILCPAIFAKSSQ